MVYLFVACLAASSLLLWGALAFLGFEGMPIAGIIAGFVSVCGWFAAQALYEEPLRPPVQRPGGAGAAAPGALRVPPRAETRASKPSPDESSKPFEIKRPSSLAPRPGPATPHSVVPSRKLKKTTPMERRSSLGSSSNNLLSPCVSPKFTSKSAVKEAITVQHYSGTFHFEVSQP